MNETTQIVHTWITAAESFGKICMRLNTSWRMTMIYVLRLPRVNTLKSFHCLNRQRVNAILHNFCKGTLASTTRSLNHKFTEERPGIAIGKIEKGEILTATQIYCDHLIKDLNPKKKSYYSCPFPLHRVIPIHSWECYILIISQIPPKHYIE